MVTFYLLFVMQLASRRVHWAGCTTSPDSSWMTQIAKNLTDTFDGVLKDSRYLLMDRDSKYSEAFCRILEQADIECLKLPPQSPNLNAHLERFMRSIKEECLDRMIFLRETSLRNAIREFLEHYHCERNHQGLGNKLIEPRNTVGRSSGDLQCRERLGGMLRYYYRQAA